MRHGVITIWKWLLIVLVGLVSMGIGFYWGQWQEHKTFSARPNRVGDAGVLPDQRPPFTLTDIAGEPRSVGEWDGRVLVINFWAPWCAPCRHEIPTFVSVQRAYQMQGLQFVGVAIDQKQPVVRYVQEVGINYPILLARLSGADLSRKYGNHLGALPFTAVVDRHGKVVFTKAGPLKRAELEAAIRPHLASLSNAG